MEEDGLNGPKPQIQIKFRENSYKGGYKRWSSFCRTKVWFNIDL